MKQKVTTTIKVTKEILIDGGTLRELLVKGGLVEARTLEEGGVRAEFKIPPGGNYTGDLLELSEDTPIILLFTATVTKTLEV